MLEDNLREQDYGQKKALHKRFFFILLEVVSIPNQCTYQQDKVKKCPILKKKDVEH